MSRSAIRINVQLVLLMVLLAGLATAAPTLSDHSEALSAELNRVGATSADGGSGAKAQPAAGASPTSGAAVAAPQGDDGASSEEKLYNILMDVAGRHRVKRPSIMGLDNYDEATTTLELIRQRHRQRSRNQKPPPSPEVIRRILRILAMGKK